MQTGWKMLNGVWYYLNESGAMETGWVQVNGKWYDAKINSKKITGNKIVFIVSLLTTPKTAHTITGIRLWDITGRICGGLEVAVKRTANQGVLAKFEFPIYEKGDE